MDTNEGRKPKPTYADRNRSLYIGAQAITRAEYYRRTENADRPLSDEGIQKHDRHVRIAR
jgi:hypothetical protein